MKWSTLRKPFIWMYKGLKDVDLFTILIVLGGAMTLFDSIF